MTHRFQVAGPDAIAAGRTTDVYFARAAPAADALESPPVPYPPVATLRDRALAALSRVRLDAPLA